MRILNLLLICKFVEFRSMALNASLMRTQDFDTHHWACFTLKSSRNIPLYSSWDSCVIIVFKGGAKSYVNERQLNALNDLTSTIVAFDILSCVDWISLNFKLFIFLSNDTDESWNEPSNIQFTSLFKFLDISHKTSIYLCVSDLCFRVC